MSLNSISLTKTISPSANNRKRNDLSATTVMNNLAATSMHDTKKFRLDEQMLFNANRGQTAQQQQHQMMLLSRPTATANQAMTTNLFAPQPNSFMPNGFSMSYQIRTMASPIYHDFSVKLMALAESYGLEMSLNLAVQTVCFITSQLGKHTDNNSPFGYSMGSRVIMISSLNPEKCTPDALFTLCGVYGDVMRVKIMFNSKDKALIQFATHQQALQAMQFLDGKELWGNKLRLHMSNSDNVQLPKIASHGDLTKDYSNSKLHRFRKPYSKNHLNIFAPNRVLHLSNLPESITELEVIQIFEQQGFHVENLRFMIKDKKMALIQLENTDVAMQALIALHNYKITENAHLRICFSKSGM